MPAFFGPLLLAATVATGTPLGIWTIESRESSPPSIAVAIGTPMTGNTVRLAMTPARWAAPPAAAITTSIPRLSSERA